MGNDEQSRILSRVKKMMNLANDKGASEGERDNALRMAHSTLAKYNLDIAQVEVNDKAKKGPATTGNADEPRERGEGVFLGRTWSRQIAMGVAELFFCTYFYQKMKSATGRTGSRNVRHSFVGRHSNVLTAMHMTEYLIDSVHREATRYTTSVMGTEATYRAFAQSAARHIHYRCGKLRQDSEQTIPDAQPAKPGMGLVLRNVYQIEAAANAEFLKRGGITIRTKTQWQKASGDHAAQEAGARHGATVSLARQVK